MLRNGLELMLDFPSVILGTGGYAGQCPSLETAVEVFWIGFGTRQEKVSVAYINNWQISF